MKQKQSTGPEAPFKNKLSEKVKDMSKLIIPKGMVLLETIKQESSVGDLYLPDTVDKAELGKEYFVVYKLGDDDFAIDHPEFKPESRTKVGNIVIVATIPMGTPILTNKDKEYVQVHDSAIKVQVTPDNFNQ